MAKQKDEMQRDDDERVAAMLHTHNGAHPLVIRLADTFPSRLMGLMLAAPLPCDQGLLITRCDSVHTLLMRYAIDLIFLDKTGVVVKCVPKLRPWRCSFGCIWRRESRWLCANHVLELQSGSIVRLGVRPGDRFESAALQHKAIEKRTQILAARERGSAMIEFALVGPVITLLGMAILQYSLLFFAKNQMNHAGFMAARAGAMANANIDIVKQAYARALIPLYGGGKNSQDLKQAFDRADKDVSANARIEIINPTKESFDDWQDHVLRETIGNGRRVISNSGLSFRNPSVIGPNSGQSIQDANLFRIRITHGYEMKVPLITNVIKFMLIWSDDGANPFVSALYRNHRIPVVTHATLQMQSDVIEPESSSSIPQAGGSGGSDQGGTIADTQFPPDCLTIGCSVITDPQIPGNVSPASGYDATSTGCPLGDPGCTQMCKVAAGGI